MMSSWSNADYVKWVYRTLLRREADVDGLQHFVGRLNAGEDLKKIVGSILNSTEYCDKTRKDAVDPLGLIGRQRRPLTIVDVGARVLDDEEHVYKPLIDNGLEWRCIAFEPQLHRLQERAAAEPDPRLVLIDAFIGDGAEGTFHCVNEDGSSSLLNLNRTFCSQFNDLSRMEVVSTEHVSTRTLDDVLEAEPYIDFLKFDIQGFEARALAGAMQLLKRTNVVHCEVFFGPMYTKSSYFRDIDLLLSEAGFRFVDFSHLNRYEYTSVKRRTSVEDRLIWGDAVFFRGDANNDDDILSQALIASLVYQKNGLAQAIMDRSEF